MASISFKPCAKATAPSATATGTSAAPAPGHFTATANDMVGPALGQSAGRAFHWDWVWATAPGNPLKNVTMHQWMYLMPDGTMLNRTSITKLGVTVAQVTERFAKVP